MIRLILAGLTGLIALAALLLSGVVAAKVGPEEILRTDKVVLNGEGHALVMDTGIVPFSHSRAFLTVSSGEELFVGTANGVDVDDYLRGAEHQEITAVSFPGDISHRVVSGSADAPVAPAGLDWWTSKITGKTSATVTFDLDKAPERIVVMSADPAKPLNLTATMGLHVDNVLGWCMLGLAVGVVLLGLALYLALGWWFGRLRPPPWRTGPPPADAPQGGGGGSAPRGRRAAAPLPEHPEASGPAPTSGEPPRPRGRRAAGMSALAVGALVLSGCAVPVQPREVHVSEPSKVSLPRSQAAKFMSGYTERLNASYGDKLEGLEDLQADPLLTRTKAQAIVAEATGADLTAVQYSDVTVAAAKVKQYPLWFIARATPVGADDQAQFLLVSRQNSTAPWKVLQSVFAPKDEIPPFVGSADGSAEVTGPADTKRQNAAAAEVASFLQTGEKPKSGASIDVDAAAFKDYREYIGELQSKDRGFSSVDVACKVLTDGDLTSHGVKTSTTALSLAEVRCDVTVKVPSSFSLNLGKAVEGLLGGKPKGDWVTVTTSHPLVLSTDANGKTVAESDDWYLIDAKAAKS